ncbi:hypothetical protein [Megalodesulfovibrio paquesii]
MKKRLFAILGVVLAVLLGGGYFAAQIAADRLVDQKLQDVLRRAGDTARVQYRDLHVNLLRQSVTLADVAIQLKDGRHATIGSLVVRNVDRKHTKPPHYLTLEMQDLTIPVDARNFQENLPAAQELGLPAIVVDMAVDYRYEPEANRLTVSEFDVDIAEGGSFRMAFALENFSVEGLKQQRFDELTLKSLSVEYKDKTILRGVLLAAGEEEKELLRYVEDWLQEEVALASQKQDAAAVSSLQALLRYLQNPAGFSMDVTLKQPLTMAKINPIKKISELLGLFTFNIR